MRLKALLLLASLCPGTLAIAQGFHKRKPTDYRHTAADNAVTALNQQLATGQAQLPAEGARGRLAALLQALDVPVTSQTLVFSKTSLQRHHISPQDPRALYFGRDAYVGWSPGAKALEIVVADARLGLVFYTLSQDPAESPQLIRNDTCLSCHASSRTDDEPGLLLRSVFPDENGDAIASAGETVVTYRTAIAERWGGWLVTGTFRGEHRGNGVAHRDDQDRWQVQSQQADNLNAFAADFSADVYPVATSDIGALLALEQQVTVHNLLIRSALQMRYLQHNDAVLNAMLDETGMREPTARIADRLAREVTAGLLMSAEPTLQEHAAAPHADFAADYQQLWPSSEHRVSLGELDLRQRTFTLPLSPMVHSLAFATLPDELRRRVLARLHKVLDRGSLPGGVTITATQRKALREHLLATLPEWR